MNQYKTRLQLKDDAKDKLTGHYGFFIGAMLFISIASSVVTTLLTGSFSTDTTAGYIIYEAVSFLIIVFMGLFSVGNAFVYLKCACNTPVAFSDLFYGFTHHQNPGLVLSAVTSAVNLLIIPADLYASKVYLETGNYMDLLVIYFGGIAIVLVIEFIIGLFLMPCFYLLLDYPGKSAGEILRLSIRIMKVHWRKLLILKLSFIPLLLLGALSFIGILWVIPYMNMTYALFYLDIMKPEQKD